MASFLRFLDHAPLRMDRHLTTHAFLTVRLGSASK
jgi:hypothetical protein